MGLHKLTAGSGYTYLTRQVAANDATDRGPGDLGTYYSQRGEAPGHWMGRGLASVPEFGNPGPVTEAQMKSLFGEGRHPDADRMRVELRAAGLDTAELERRTRLGHPYRLYRRPTEFTQRCLAVYRAHNRARELPPTASIPADERAAIRTGVARQTFTEVHGRPPADARELSGHLARAVRPATTAVAGYDLTFSPVKSVSVLWALAAPELAAVIEQAHADAVADTVAWLEEHAAYTRRGHNGVAQVDVTGLITAAFTHRDSRRGDPDLHTHVALANKVQALDGTWLALDGRPLYANAVAASERYNTRLEALLTGRLGVVFADRPGAPPGKRAIREIVGIDGELPRRWSSRRAEIEVRSATLIDRFQADHGRVPTADESVELAQQATLETRPGKHAPRSHAQQRAAWHAEAVQVLGGEDRLRAYVQRALGQPPARRDPVTVQWVAATARAVLARVAATRATWQRHHLQAETERQVRAAGVPSTDIDGAVDAVVTASIAASVPLQGQERCAEPSAQPCVEPAPLRRRDGSSVFVVAGSARYTSREVLDAERAILAAAAGRDGRAVPAADVARALDRLADAGLALTADQGHLVRQLATSGARVQLAVAAAGTGKTTALRGLSAVWTAHGGTVFGLAPSAAAAGLLREELAAPTDTLAKCAHALTAGGRLPKWLADCGPETLLLIDEAGMAATTELAAAIGFVTARGGSVRLIGDDGQLAAVGAGGVLRDLAHQQGSVTLSRPLRFRDARTGAVNRAEGAASLALRAGDPAGLGFYFDHGRVHVGAAGTAAASAYAAWAADRAAGLDALLLAPTRELVTELNARARRDRLATQPRPGARTAALADGLSASAGDVVLTRRNDRRLRATDPRTPGAAHWVRNGDRWLVRAVSPGGGLVVTHARTGARVTLPPGYVAEHVALGYASTVHAAQGLTADTCHTVVTGAEGRRALYVALTRGRYANHVHVETGGDGDPHALITRDALLPPTAGEVLARVLARDEASPSATGQLRELTDPGPRLADAAARYTHALHTAADERLGAAGTAALDRLGEAIRPGLTDCPAWAGLRFRLAAAALDGRDAAVLLRAAADRALDDARDPAAVLDWRLRGDAEPPGPLPWLAALPATLAGDPVWGPYLRHREEVVQACAATVRAAAGEADTRCAAQWTAAVAGRDGDPRLLADLAVWRAAHGVDDGDPRPTGPPQTGARDARAQAGLQSRVGRALERSDLDRWRAPAAAVDPRLPADAYWPVLAARLQDLDRTGAEAATLLARVGRERPLPDEQPAAALWWRLLAHRPPEAAAAAALAVTGRSGRDRRGPRPPQAPAVAPRSMTGRANGPAARLPGPPRPRLMARLRPPPPPTPRLTGGRPTPPLHRPR